MNVQYPTYRAIADIVRKKILSGDLEAGSPVEPYRELMAVYEVARATLDRAWELLEKEGILELRGDSRPPTVRAIQNLTEYSDEPPL